MSRKFNIGDEVICINASNNDNLTKYNKYEVLNTRYQMDAPFVQVINNIGNDQYLHEDRFCLDTPENRRKLQIEKMFESYGK